MTVLNLPRFTRASDLRSLDECMLRYALEKYHAEELDDAGYFFLGTALHESFEKVATDDISKETGIQLAKEWMGQALYENEEDGRGMRWTKRRTADTWMGDVERIFTKWWDDVHPSSPTRIKRYNEFKWPFEAETVIDTFFVGSTEREHRLHTTTDAIFTHNTGEWDAIVDWKTGATAKAKDIQLWTYDTGLKLMGNETPRELWFHHADHSKMQNAQFHPGDWYVKEWIEETQGRKERGVFPATPDWWCNYCRVKDRCPVWEPKAIRVNELAIHFVDTPEEYYGI